jgi:hypothetical protein
MLTQDATNPTLWHHETLGDIWARPGQTAAQITAEIAAMSSPATIAAQAAEAKRAAVNTERECRIAAGATVTVTGAGAIPVQGREQDVRNLQGLGLMALARVSAGDTTTVTTFRDAANVDHDLTPPQILDLVQRAAAAAEAIIQASWVIKAMDPLPDDVTADALWPAT